MFSGGSCLQHRLSRTREASPGAKMSLGTGYTSKARQRCQKNLHRPFSFSCHAWKSWKQKLGRAMYVGFRRCCLPVQRPKANHGCAQAMQMLQRQPPQSSHVEQMFAQYVRVHEEILCNLQGFLAEGLQRTSAGLGSVIIDSQPLSVALLASVLFGETLTVAGYGGLVVGLLGLCLLEVTPQTLADLLNHG